jgi:hypothetical protein
MYRGLGVKCPLRVGPACDNSFRFVVAAIRVAIGGDFTTIRNGRETLTIQIHASPGANRVCNDYATIFGRWVIHVL